jgi:hypothetical protein
VEVRSKRQFFEMWEAGLLGNRTRLWRDPGEAFDWGEQESRRRAGFTVRPDGNGMNRVPVEIGFRQIGAVGGGKWEKVAWQLVFETAKKWQSEGRNFIMDDGAPDDKRVFQGEVCRTHRGLEGFLDVTGKLPMRPAMAAGHMRHCSPTEVRALLERFMDPSSQDDLEAILELFPDAAVEFSCFSVNVGVFPHRNTLFWEVRNY